MANVLATFAQFERRLISERTRDALSDEAAGWGQTGSPAGDGPTEVVLRINRRAGRWGQRLQAIASSLNRDGVPTAHGGAALVRLQRREGLGPTGPSGGLKASPRCPECGPQGRWAGRDRTEPSSPAAPRRMVARLDGGMCGPRRTARAAARVTAKMTTPPSEEPRMGPTLRGSIGSARYGIEAHDAPVQDFPAQPSQNDGPGADVQGPLAPVHGFPGS